MGRAIVLARAFRNGETAAAGVLGNEAIRNAWTPLGERDRAPPPKQPPSTQGELSKATFAMSVRQR